MFPVIGLCGVARSGKNHIANILRDYFGLLPWAYANTLKFQMYGKDTNSWTLEQLFYLEKPVELRQELQIEGTELGRDVYGQQYWIKQTEAFLFLAERDFKARGASVLDIRFPNEATFIKDLGGVVLRIEREGAGLQGGQATHRSESQIEDIKVDGIIYNHNFPSDENLVKQLTPYLLKLGVE